MKWFQQLSMTLVYTDSLPINVHVAFPSQIWPYCNPSSTEPGNSPKAWDAQFMKKSQSAPTHTPRTPHSMGTRDSWWLTIHAMGSSKALCCSSSCTLHTDGGRGTPQDSRPVKSATFTREQHASYGLKDFRSPTQLRAAKSTDSQRSFSSTQLIKRRTSASITVPVCLMP